MNNYHFEDHHLLLREQVRKMVEKHVAPIASEIDENNRFPEELVEVFGDMGLLQLWVPRNMAGPAPTSPRSASSRRRSPRSPNRRRCWPPTTPSASSCRS